MTQIRKLLAMDKASRMARAAEMGLTTPGFHGTTYPFDEFRPSQANNPNWDGRPDQYAGTHFAKDRAVPRHLLDLARYNRKHGGGWRQGGEYRIISAILPDRADMKVVPQLPARSGWGDEMVHPQEDTDAIRDFLLHEYYKSDPENLERAIAEGSPQMTKQGQRAVLEHLIGPDWQSYHAAKKQRHTNTFGKPYRETPVETRLESLGPDTYQEEAVQLDKIKKQHDELALEQPGGRASDAWHNRLPTSVVLGRAVADGGVAALQKQGIRGLVYQNTNRAELGGIKPFKIRMDTDPESYIVFDPANIRDRKAAFDPSKRLSRNLMSSVAAATAVGIGAGLSTQDAEAAQTGKLLRAFHGSPYDFDKFDASHIGTGAGGQAYGKGTNLSKSESIAEGYRNSASALHRSPEEDALELWRRETEKLGDPQRGVLAAMDRAEKHMKEAEGNSPTAAQRWDDILGKLYNIDYRQPLPKRSGTLYEVEVAHPKKSLLNYDHPFSTPTGAAAAGVLRDFDPVAMPSSTLQDIKAGVYQGDGGYLDHAARNLRHFARASYGGEALSGAGIPGHHYQQSLQNGPVGALAAAKKTTNYLMYPGNEDAIRIIRKYAVPGLVTAAAGGAAAQAQDGSVLDSRTEDSATAQARDLQQEAGQNTVHQQQEPEFNQSGDVGDYIGNEPPTGAISGESLRQYLAPEDKERDYSPRGMYARSILNAMSQPVIQNPSSGEYLSMSEYVKQRVRADAMQKLGDIQMTDEVRERVQAAIEERASMAADNVGGVLAGTLRTNNQYTKDLAAQVRSEVQRHAPGGDKALLGHRTQSEENTAQQEYGSESKHMLTADGQRNHQALAISELLNAQDTNYAPDTGLSHTARLIGSVVAPAYNMFTSPGGGGEHGFHLPRTTGEILDEDALFRKPDGRLEYAANLYARSRDQSSASVYTPEGRPKYEKYNMQGITGVAEATQENTAYPLAGWYQGSLGAASLGELASNMAAPGYRNNVAALRAATKRTTPVIPDGVAPEKVQQLSRQLGGATDKLQGWTSAYAGPKFADAANAVLGGKEVPRTYLSKAAEIATELPAEILGDPLNLIGTAMYPPLAAMRGGMGAATSGIRSMLGAGAVAGARSIPKAAVTVRDDLFQEAGTSAGLLSTAGNLGQAFLPQKTNSLMGDINPNTPGFDQQLERNSIEQRMLQQDAAEQYAKMTGTYVPPKPKKPMSLPPTNWLQP